MSATPKSRRPQPAADPARRRRTLGDRARQWRDGSMRAGRDARDVRADREFLPAALEIIETPASPARTGLLWLTCAMIAAALLWSVLTELDIYAVAPGRLQIAGRSKLVQSFEAGRVRAILVQNGQRVAAGETVAVIDPTEALADADAHQRTLLALDAEILRRRAVVATVRSGTMQGAVAFPDAIPESLREREREVLAADLAHLATVRGSLDAQVTQATAQRTRLQMGLDARRNLIATLKERIDMRTALLSRGVGSRASVLDALQVMQAEEATLASEAGQLIEAEAARSVLDRKRDQIGGEFIDMQVDKIAEAARRRDVLQQELVKARAKAERTRLIAPITGTVQQLALTTIGQVVASGEPLMVVVPSEGTLEIEALVGNRDIGFIALGQAVRVKVDAFPFTHYGTIDGTVLRISGDAVGEREVSGSSDALGLAGGQSLPRMTGTARVQNLAFPVTIGLAKTELLAEGRRTPLIPGMTVSVEIRTGTRRVIDYLLSPVRDIGSAAGRER